MQVRAQTAAHRHRRSETDFVQAIVHAHAGFVDADAGLEKLQEDYAERGFRVLGFPCNDFGAQEPGTDADIKSFFDTVSHEWLIKFLEHRIGDPRIIRLIGKWLKAGTLEAWLLGLWRSGHITVPPLFIDLVVQAVLLPATSVTVTVIVVVVVPERGDAAGSDNFVGPAPAHTGATSDSATRMPATRAPRRSPTSSGASACSR